MRAADATMGIEHVAAAIGDASRARMLSALLGGQALTAGELARIAEVTPATCSSHLAKLHTAGLVKTVAQGRHRYYRLAGAEVADLLERLQCLTPASIQQAVGPKDAQLRHARICYDHLAGDCGVRLFDALLARGWLMQEGDAVALTAAGRVAMSAFGIDVDRLDQPRRVQCRPCLDWSVRRPHLAGSLAAAVLDHLLEQNWLRRRSGTRALVFTAHGAREFTSLCGGA